jgi:4-hydroxy-3-polyprenylbenzoate decarboxylase
MKPNEKRKILVAVTGASGSIYAERLITELCKYVPRIYLVVTESGESVIQYELTKGKKELSLISLIRGNIPAAYAGIIKVFKNNDFFAPIASGSSAATDMVVTPCSMGTLARIRHGLSQNLIDRAADVVMKEGKNLILCPRESPFNTIHLENMLALSRIGVKIVPLMPAFYQKPKDLNEAIDFLVGKMLEQLGIEHDLYKPWDERRS